MTEQPEPLISPAADRPLTRAHAARPNRLRARRRPAPPAVAPATATAPSPPTSAASAAVCSSGAKRTKQNDMFDQRWTI